MIKSLRPCLPFRGSICPLPDSTAGLDAAAQPVADTAALDVVAGNYATCNAIAGQLTELQAWVQAQSQE